MMNTPSPEVILEQHLEREALKACRSTTFVQCLKNYNIAPTITVIPSAEEDSLSIRASDIAASKKRFFEERVDIDQSEYPLSIELERLVDLYEHFLLNEHTPRYRLLVSPTQRQWLRRVVTLVVVRYIMEQKYERSVVEGRRPFADMWVGNEMERLMILRSLPGMVAQLVHHIVKDPNQAQEMIEQLHNSIDIRMRVHTLVSPKHLPPLPQGGKSLPLALLYEEEYNE